MARKTTDKYRLQVTAGPEYDPASHFTVPVNQDETLEFENDHASVSICVRVRNFRGYPEGSHSTHSYFSNERHKNDQYSISFAFEPKRKFSGNSLVFGNDFDNPIRDRLPPCFNAAFRFVKWMIDPGLEGDAYADKPYLYGPLLSSLNYLRICGNSQLQSFPDYEHNRNTYPVGQKTTKHYQLPSVHERGKLHQEIIAEGGETGGERLRRDMNIPDKAEQRQKYFLQWQNREAFRFEPGITYKADFGNPYLDFGNFSLKLPGFNVSVLNYVDNKTHHLRYVLKDRDSGDVIFALVFTLIYLPGLGIEAA